MLRFILPVALMVCLSGCREKNDDPLRLDRSVEPLSQSMVLSLDPAQDNYSGSVETQIKINYQTDTFRFHGRDLGIIEIRIKSKEIEEPLDFITGPKGTVTAQSGRPLEPGFYSLGITFTNAFSRQGTGIYKVEYEGRNYLFTQMEPEYAREAFPCWDAPEFKIPWELQLIVPSNTTAYANTPIKSERLLGELKEVVFEPTPPMPSYLVALAVGAFEDVEIPDFPVNGKLIVPKGKTGLAGEAARISPPLLLCLENYFGIPYPYGKLDQIAVPEFNYGAMENAGLITYRDTALLRDPKALTLAQKQHLASIIAHEMSHMWFGNLVTPVWWDDLWLNESFASWIALKTVNEVFPEYEMENNDIESRQHAMGTDALSTSKPIRRPIAASDSMQHLFDALAYNKGMAVLDMVENWMGKDAFRTGMTQYMNDNAWGNADAFDLAESLSTAVDSDVLAIMKSFINQAGIPLLTVEPVGTDRLRITQQRYAQYGIQLNDPARWIVPVVLKYSDGQSVHTQKVLLKDRSHTFKLDHPMEWLYSNADEKGYYRWTLPPDAMAGLAAQLPGLGIRNRLGFIHNLEALFSAGELEAGDYLRLMASFSTDPSPEVRQAVVGNLNGFAGRMIPPELEEVYGVFLFNVCGPMLDAIGTTKMDGEPALVEKLRPGLIDALGWRCKVPELLRLAEAKANDYMADPYAVDPSLAQSFLRLAAMNGNAALFEAYVAKYESATVPTEKANYLKGLSGFRDPELMRRALNYAISDAVPPHQFGSIPYSLADTDHNRRLIFQWLEANYATIQKKIPEQSLNYLPWLFSGQSPELLEEAEAFLLADGRATQGMKVESEKAGAVVSLNDRLRKKELVNVRRFLQP